MTTQEIDKRLIEIAHEANEKDYELAHLLEKQLWEDVLDAIARGAANPNELADRALQSTRLEFDRWFA